MRLVLDLPASEIEPPPPFGPRVRVDCLLGMGRAGKKFVLLLDIDKLLSTDELAVAAQVAEAAAAEGEPQAAADEAAPDAAAS